MSMPTEAQSRAWMMQWRSAAVALERVRVDEVRGADLTRVAADLEDACVTSARATARDSSSGLITQQAILHHARPA